MIASVVPKNFSLREDPLGYLLRADDNTLMTPGGNPFIIPNFMLANAVMDEWRAQSKKINPRSMPLTQLAATALDIITSQRERTLDQLIAYAETDLLCHFAENPPELVNREKEVWLPILAWCEERFRAPLATGTGVISQAQSPEALASLRNVIETCNDFVLAGLRFTADTSGSLVLSLALYDGHLSWEAAFTASEVDNDFQIKKWGEDPVLTSRRDELKKDLELCHRWFRLLT